MSAPTRRSLERRIADLEDDGATADDIELIIRDSLVISREQAEREGLEILDEADKAGYVCVPCKGVGYP